MSTITLGEAKAQLQEILDGLDPGARVVIVEDGVEVATLTKSGPKRSPRKAGSAKDTVHWMAPDFDAPLEEFEEY